MNNINGNIENNQIMEEEEKDVMKKFIKDQSYITNSKIKNCEKRLEDIVKLLENNFSMINERMTRMENKLLLFEEHIFKNSNNNSNNNLNNNNVSINNNIETTNEEIKDSQEDKTKTRKRANIDKMSLIKKISSSSSLNNEKKNKKDKNDEYMEIKEELFEIDQDLVKRCLEANSVNSDVRIFKEIYIEKRPIEFISMTHHRKKFKYWLNGRMNDDINGDYIKNTIIKNIESIYRNYNIYDNYKDNLNTLLSNQNYINKMSDEKNKDKFFQLIIPYISN